MATDGYTKHRGKSLKKNTRCASRLKEPSKQRTNVRPRNRIAPLAIHEISLVSATCVPDGHKARYYGHGPFCKSRDQRCSKIFCEVHVGIPILKSFLGPFESPNRLLFIGLLAAEARLVTVYAARLTALASLATILNKRRRLRTLATPASPLYRSRRGRTYICHEAIASGVRLWEI
nr:hypothetical protein CFP56_74119 [Quercus suber]